MARGFLRELCATVLSVAITTGATGATLRLLRDIPSLIQENTVRLYRSTEEAEQVLGLKLLLPAYFPESFVWPPQEIRLKREGDTSVISLSFTLQKGKQRGLVIHQIVSPDGMEQPELDFDEPRFPDHEKLVRIEKATGTLRTGNGIDGKHWARLTWKTQDRLLVLMSSCDSETLLRMARSMD